MSLWNHKKFSMPIQVFYFDYEEEIRRRIDSSDELLLQQGEELITEGKPADIKVLKTRRHKISSPVTSCMGVSYTPSDRLTGNNTKQ
jgi:hypothetical protein